MDPIAIVKERSQAETPLLLIECTFADGEVRRWSTHSLSYLGNGYEARVLQHNLFEIQSMSEQGLDQVPRLSLSLANADAAMAQLDQSKGFKGAGLLARFVFFDVTTMEPSPDSLVVFSGYCNPPDEVSDREMRITAINRMNMARVWLPPVKIQRRCPWPFPATAGQRTAARNDANSPYYTCGYSPDAEGGCGRTQAGGMPFTSCGYTREDCIARGMFNHDAAAALASAAQAGSSQVSVTRDIASASAAIDIGGDPDARIGFQHQEEARITWKSGSGDGPFLLGLDRPLRFAHSAGEAAGRPTRRFGGIEFVPETIEVRPYGSPSSIKSATQSPVAHYNDPVPLVYGTALVQPVITVLRNDGNVTRMEAVLSLGRISGVQRVVVNDYEIPAGQPGKDMTGSGWWNLITDGGPWGGFDLNFTDKQGNPQGDPYGSMVCLSIVVPNKINDGKAAPRVQVLLDGRMLETVADDGHSLGFSFTNNTAWVLLDLLKRARWPVSQMDLPSFAAAAAFCGEMIPATDNDGQALETPRFRCNLVVDARRAASDVILGVRNNARLFFTYSMDGKLQVRVENTIALQQPALPYGSNAAAPIAGGWPAYLYSDTNGTIARKANGASSLRVFHRSITDTPNRFAFEFQDELNQYAQDSLAIDDLDDQARAGQEVSQTLAADGIPNFHQAARIAKFHLDKSVRGNTFVEFETSVKAIGQQVGQVVALSYAREGWDHQLFRILKLAPQQSYRTVRITAQIHEDAWYSDTDEMFAAVGRYGRQPRRNARPPNPLTGLVPRPDGEMDWAIAEMVSVDADGTGSVELEAGFAVPENSFRGTAGAPSADLVATVYPSGGSIAGGQTLYYRVTARDGDGQQSIPSFAVRAVVPEGSNTNAVELTGLRFDTAASSFQVYRGKDPATMFLISGDAALAPTFFDAGFPAQASPLPDPYFDHANFYWKKRTMDESQADIVGDACIGSTSLSLSPEQYAGQLVRIVQGAGAGQVRRIIAHNDTTFQLSPDWTVAPEAGSVFHVEEPDWKLGSAAVSSPARFRVPNQRDAVVLITGRAADEHDSESTQERAVVTSWTVGGIGPGVSDTGTPPAPAFGISVPRDGTLVLTPPSFTALTNVSSISSITFQIFYADELNPVTASLAAAGIGPNDTVLQVDSPVEIEEGDFLVAGDEVMQVSGIDDTEWTVSRGEKATNPAAHAGGTRIDKLVSRLFVYSVQPGFFFSPDALKWSATVVIPEARVSTVEASVTNVFGDSPKTINNYLIFDSDSGASGSLPGLRTNRGGQFVFQAAGPLVIENDAASLPVHLDCSVRDVYALAGTAPAGGPLEITLRRNGDALQSIAIAAGQTASPAASGVRMLPLRAGDRLSFDVDCVGTTEPGRDLTVVVRI